MTTMTQAVPARVTVGVDTHADVHVAVATDSLGRPLDAISVAPTPAGYAELLAGRGAWVSSRPGGSRAPDPLGLG
jgi:transposase